MKFIDINCDMGEERGNDGEIIKYISSANIACGGHAGSMDTIKKTVNLALKYGVCTGAHPGYADKDNFGRIETGMGAADICEIVVQQFLFFKDIVGKEGAKVSHVKLHGALYNRASADYGLLRKIIETIDSNCENITYYILSGASSTKAVQKMKGKFYNEVFADRAYTKEGSLVPRGISGAVLHDINRVAKRSLSIVLYNEVETITGEKLKLDCDTICIHGDTTGSVSMARKIYETFEKEGIMIRGTDEI